MIKRTGDCFTQVCQRMLDDPFMFGHPLVAVHGLPTGTSGYAGKVGQYPHAWLEVEFNGIEIVYDTVVGCQVFKDAYYQLGQIEYTVRYDAEQVKAMTRERETYGPWDREILHRDEEIKEEFEV